MSNIDRIEMPILVIIDMQPTFPASQNKVLIKNLCREIRRFKSNGWWILVVEYGHWWSKDFVPNDYRTDRRLIRVIGDYRKCYFVTKKRDDGSSEVKTIVDQIGGPYRKQMEKVLYIGGVNASACVISTVNGLGRNMPEMPINVIADCCGDWDNRMPFLKSDPSDFPANVVLQRQETT